MLGRKSVLLRIIGIGIISLSSGCSVPDTAAPILIDMEPAIQMSAGMVHTCATLRNGNVGCWGKADGGEFGKALDSMESSTSKATPLPILEKVSFVGAGTDGSCAVIADRTVQCWGIGLENQLGVDLDCNAGYSRCLFPPSKVAGLTDIVTIASKKGMLDYVSDVMPVHATCALDISGLVRCWGAPNANELGRIDMQSDPTKPEIVVDEQGFTLRDIIQISAGDARMCAVDTFGSVWCWGKNTSYGQPESAGAKKVLLPKSAKAVASGIGHSCAVLDDGHVACWGRNINGECGVSSTKNGYCQCSEGTGCLADCVTEPVIVNNLSNAIGIAAGEYHSCAWTATGEAFCWGSNQVLQLGHSTRMLESPPIQVTSISSTVVEMVAGRDHSCALLDDGRIYCWGGSGYGQAGL